MTQSEIKEHKHLKEKHVGYPKLPKFILNQDLKGYVEPNAGLKDSCIRGFNDRLQNWKRQHLFVESSPINKQLTQLITNQ